MWAERLRGKTIAVFTDNQNAYFALRKGWTKSTNLSRLAKQAWDIIWQFEIRLIRVYWLPSKVNWEADAISRLLPERFSDWALTNFYYTKFVKKLLKRGLPIPTVDAFATRLNRRLERYMSLYRDIDSLGDFFWTFLPDEILWCNPPFSIIGKVLAHLLRHNFRAYLLVPIQPSRHWWPRIINMRGFNIEVNPDHLMFSPRVAPERLTQPGWRVRVVCVNS